MKTYAYAKINWALNILGARPDGYHEMDMLMQRVSLCDALEFERDPGELVLECADAELATGSNLVLKAADALNRASGTRHGARIRLGKRIPSKAGLGGGSADCAATLRALNQLWALGLGRDKLLEIGQSLGADVPFCLTGKPARVGGLGEVIRPVSLPAGIPILMLHPGGGLSTPRMFRAWDEEAEHEPNADIEACVRALNARDWAALGRASRNALLPAAIRSMPDIETALRALRDAGAPFAAMSGSGSAVFGAFPSASEALAAKRKLGARAILCETL